MLNLTSKQRAYLGSEASTMSPIFQIGKASLTPELITALDEECIPMCNNLSSNKFLILAFITLSVALSLILYLNPPYLFSLYTSSLAFWTLICF